MSDKNRCSSKFYKAYCGFTGSMLVLVIERSQV